jgi:ABC-type lipoprotein release transport system permease subunit
MVWRLALRGLFRNPRRTGVVLAAVAVGIAGCALTVAINAGFAAQMVKTAIATELGHVQIHAPGFEADPELRMLLSDDGAQARVAIGDAAGVRAWARRVRGQGLANSPRASVGVRVVAVQPEAERLVSSYARSMVEGEWLGDRRGRAVIGTDLARRLRVELGDKVVLSVQDLAGDLTGRAFRVQGLFRTASRPVNESTVLLRLDEGQELFGLGPRISEIVVVADEDDAVDALRESLAGSLGSAAEVRTWQELAPLLVYLVETMDQMAWVIYAGVFIAMAFGIANVLLMSIYERTRELGVMMAMGMKPRRVVLSVVAEAMIVTGAGLGLGLAAGVLGVWLLRDGIDLSMFADGLEALGVGTRIVPVVRANDLAAPAAMALLASLAASTWPAVRAASLRPGEALRRV